MSRLTYLFLLFTCLNCTYMSAQSFRVEDFKKNFSKEEWFKVNGNVSVTGSYYGANTNYGITPWNYAIVGSVNFSLFNLIQIPFTLNITNSGINYTYPNLPNRFAIHPSYKWATLHVGDISMSYSPYTLSGHQFTGIGVDLKPDNWEASVMFGRMQRAVEYDSLNTLTAVPAAYKRLGVGAKLKYNHAKFYLGGNVFLAKDDITSLKWQPDSLGILPKQNIAGAVEAGLSIVKNLQLSVNYGFSILYNDIRNIENDPANTYHAVKADISYSIKSHKIGVGYERIDPQYQTLGAYYFNSDLENYTLQYAGTMWKDKMNLSARAGVERNNILNDKDNKEIRFVGSMQLDIKPIENLQLSASYSNFQTHQRVKSQFDYINEFDAIENSDTLNYQQVSHQADIAASYQVEQTKSYVHGIQLNSSYQLCADSYTYSDTTTANQMLNAMLMYQCQLVEKNCTLSLSLNYTNSNTNINSTHYFGPTINCSTSFINKTLRFNASFSCNQGFTDNRAEQFITNLRLLLSYTLMGKHCFTLSGNGQYKNHQQASSYLVNSSISYSYSF